MKKEIIASTKSIADNYVTDESDETVWEFVSKQEHYLTTSEIAELYIVGIIPARSAIELFLIYQFRNAETIYFHPSEISQMTGVPKKTVIKILDKLYKQGEITSQKCSDEEWDENRKDI